MIILDLGYDFGSLLFHKCISGDQIVGRLGESGGAGGTATLTTAALSAVGMHSITAHYLGDATYTQASSSGALNVMVTGTTQLPITGTSGSATASGNVSLTIN